jgi:alpha-L-fucosidase
LETFRDEGFWTGIYFSKPDWSTEYYWWPYYATPDRHVNYDPAKHPERWQKFKDYTYDQIEELMSNYGSIDILWLDGAWVRPIDNMPEKYKEWAKKKNWNQDVDMARIATMARKHQPELLIVDRWVKSKYENYLTPENRIPENMIPYPWESCITSTPGWSYTPKAKFKSAHKLISILVNVVSKGGNLLLNIGPSPEGIWPSDANDRLKKIGDWMSINGEAIYDTRAIGPYKDGKVCLTQNKNTQAVYAIYLSTQEERNPPSKIWLNKIQPADEANVTILGRLGRLKWEKVGTGFSVDIPKDFRDNPPCPYAWVVKISAIRK